jgi:arylsulfatase A-like enzyme
MLTVTDRQCERRGYRCEVGRRSQVLLGGFLAASAIAVGTLLLGRGDSPERIVLIVVDTLRRDHVSAYGAEYPTPAIDAIAARGQVFERYLAAFYQTSMSMAALFTGRVPSIESGDPRDPLPWNGSTWCGLARFADEPSELECIPASLSTLAERLREAGYWTMGVFSNYLLFEPSGFARGFDDSVELGRRAPSTTKEVLANRRAYWSSRRGESVQSAVETLVERRPRDRFFLYVHYMDVHDYWLRGLSYAEGVALSDEAVGRLMDHLGSSGLLDDAVVILTSDHGQTLGEVHPTRPGPSHTGNPSYQELLRVPLVVAPPVFEDTGSVLRTHDLYYRILEIADAGVERPASPLAAGELFTTESSYRTFQKGRWKSTEHRGNGDYQLFDLEDDPGEQRNVSREHPGVAREHRHRMEHLGRALASPHTPSQRGLSARDRERLEALGYLE